MRDLQPAPLDLHLNLPKLAIARLVMAYIADTVLVLNFPVYFGKGFTQSIEVDFGVDEKSAGVSRKVLERSVIGVGAFYLGASGWRLARKNDNDIMEKLNFEEK